MEQQSICDIFVFSVEVQQDLFVYELADYHFVCLHIWLYIDKSYLSFKVVCIILLHVTFYVTEYDWDEWWDLKTTVFQGDLYSFIMASKKM
jgi:hypothetical protein